MVQRDEAEGLDGFSVIGEEDDENGMVHEGIMQSYGRGEHGDGGISALSEHVDDEDDSDEDENTPLDDLRALEAEEEARNETTVDRAVQEVVAQHQEADTVNGSIRHDDNRHDPAGLEEARLLARLAAQGSPPSPLPSAAHGWVTTNGTANKETDSPRKAESRAYLQVMAGNSEAIRAMYAPRLSSAGG